MEQTQEIVRIVATTKKYEKAPFFMAPEFGSDRKPIYYFDKDNELSDKDKADFREALAFTDTSDESGVLKLHHLMRLSMNDMRDKAIFYYLKNLPEHKTIVAQNKLKVNPSKHRFYIENKEVEAVSSISRYAYKKKALDIADEIISKNSDKNQTVKDALRLLGVPIKGISNSQAASSLLQVADLESKKFLTVLDDKYREYKVFIVKCIEKDIIYKHTSGSYSYGEKNNIIAQTENQMIAFLQDKANQNLVTMWSKTLEDDRISTKPSNSPLGKNNSISVSIKAAVERIESMETEKEVEDYTHGENRDAVLKVALDHMEKLKNK